MKPVTITYKNKKISFLKVKEGDYKAKKGDNEKKQLVETNEIHHGKVQTFNMNLGKSGRADLGGIQVEYWGDKTLEEGKYIDLGCFYLKQKKGETKDPKTFITKKMSQVILVMVDFHSLIDEKDSHKKYDENKNPTPEESIKLAVEEYNKGKEEELVEINDEFPKFEEL